MGRVITRALRELYEKDILEVFMSGKNGSVIQRQEARAFTPENAGSNPAGPTKDILVVKKCQHCSTPMYIRKVIEQEPFFTGCEPCIVDIKLERSGEKEIKITGRRSTKVVRCFQCKRKHLLSSFEEVKDGIPITRERA